MQDLSLKSPQRLAIKRKRFKTFKHETLLNLNAIFIIGVVVEIKLYEVKEIVKNTKNSVFFTDKNEAKDFAIKIDTAMRKNGFKVIIYVNDVKTADGKSVYEVTGALLWFASKTKKFTLKEEAEKEVKRFYKDLKDVTPIFEITATTE